VNPCNPTSAHMFATTHYVTHHARNDLNRPAYWLLTSANGMREVWVVTTFAEVRHWIEVVFGPNAVGVNAQKWRTAIGTPPF